MFVNYSDIGSNMCTPTITKSNVFQTAITTISSESNLSFLETANSVRVGRVILCDVISVYVLPFHVNFFTLLVKESVLQFLADSALSAR